MMDGEIHFCEEIPCPLQDKEMAELLANAFKINGEEQSK